MNGYKKLKECTDELLGQETDPNDDQDILVTEGGWAAIGYSRLQFEALDALAMVIILER